LSSSRQGRVLALDYGRAHCGCAVSDPLGTIASPLDPIADPSSEAGLGQIAALVVERGAQMVVVGLPVGLSGQRGPQAKETIAFVERLRGVLAVPVETYDERFTSALARRTGGSASEHSRAAAHLLSEYLRARAAKAREREQEQG
jgi:putative Holliday junction resolvase